MDQQQTFIINNHKGKVAETLASWLSAFAPWTANILFDSRVLRGKMLESLLSVKRLLLENPTCIARLVQFEVLAVAMQPRFHHIQDLNEVTVGPVCSVGHQCKMG